MAPTQMINNVVAAPAAVAVPAGFRPPPGLEAPAGLVIATPAVAPFRAPPGLTLDTSFAAAAPQSNKTARVNHRLVWCYEFCHNDENRERRHLIKTTTTEMKWSFSFLKKAMQFTKWLEEGKGDEYALVMGWREAQPCLQSLTKNGGKLPMMSVIICENRKQAARATTFVQALPSNMGKVEVCLQDAIPSELLGGLLRNCFGPMEEAEAASPMLPVNKWSDNASVSTRSGSSTPSTQSDDGASSSGESDRFQQPLEQLRLQKALQALQANRTPAGPLPVGRVQRNEAAAPCVHDL
mmetsp:Transcript_61924/g.114922  ORF Transcript_61924/g.114922 Transcript_61924/m.114922 type:complete len:295 (-) Transcript_61924:67-951(-)